MFEGITMIHQYGGEFAGIGTAFFWALSAIAFAYAARAFPVLRVNFWKTLIGFVLTGGLLVILGAFPFRMELLPMLFFGISGILGISLGDIAYLNSLNAIGPRRTLLIGTLTPPMTALIATFLLGEHLSLRSWMGILLTVAGVAWVITERKGIRNGAVEQQKPEMYMFGFLFMVAQVGATLLSRAAFRLSDTGPYEAAFVRLAFALAVLFFWVVFFKSGQGVQSTPSAIRHAQRMLFLGSVSGPFIAMALLQLSLKLAPAGISQTLVSTNALFALGFSALMGERISLRAVFGALLAVAGIILLFGIL
jgi:drug/metabolite transporter (DMT)-like permease